MADAILRSLTGTASDDALHGPCQVWGLAVASSGSATVNIQLHDNVSSTGTIIVQLSTKIVSAGATPQSTKYELQMFNRPLRFSTAMSITADANVTRYWVFIGGK